jgi:hypothetical protein
MQFCWMEDVESTSVSFLVWNELWSVVDNEVSYRMQWNLSISCLPNTYLASVFSRTVIERFVSNWEWEHFDQLAVNAI